MARALFIIDVQNDFTEGGSLGVDGGAAVAAGVSQLLSDTDYDVVFASRDWHDPDSDNGGHIALDGNPDYVTTWPVHCIAGTHGAEYHPDLTTDAIDIHVRKGQGVPAYSIFEGTTDDGETMQEALGSRGITEVEIVGIATDHCVLASARDALAAGLAVTVRSDLIAGVAAEPSAKALRSLAEAGATVTT